MAIGKVIKGEGTMDAPDTSARPAFKPSRGVVGAEEFEARTTATQIVTDAQKKAEQIIAEAEAKRDAMLAEGREAGRQEGLAQLTETLVKARLARDAMLAAAEPEAVKLALKIAEKIIGHDVERDPDLLVDLAATAMDHARGAPSVTLRVHPSHAKLLRTRLPRLMEQLGATRTVLIKDDPDVTGGGCILETPHGTVDAQLFTQLKVLEQVLLPDPGKREGLK
ncbi:MAG: type III secretion system stator protein SctL [Deltaproteobacteria bacterium]|nr:type III secretion system stator protein SctL [Deltaproteobacteria bacterium]